MPGRYNMAWFRATKLGSYHLFCAEYCGTEHARMTGRVVVMEPEAYQTWLAGGPAPESPRAAGEKLFTELNCITCHRPDDAGRGPVLLGVFGRPVKLASGDTLVADEAYVRESILSPSAKVVAGYQPVMPTFQGQVRGAAARSHRLHRVAAGSCGETMSPEPIALPEDHSLKSGWDLKSWLLTTDHKRMVFGFGRDRTTIYMTGTNPDVAKLNVGVPGMILPQF